MPPSTSGRMPDATSDLGLYAAGAGEAPAAQGFVDGKQAGDHQHDSPQGNIPGDDNPGHKAKRAGHATGDAPLTADVGPEEIAHAKIYHSLFAWQGCLLYTSPSPRD